MAAAEADLVDGDGLLSDESSFYGNGFQIGC